MGPNPNAVAVGTSILLGVLVVFWNIALKRMSGIEFMLILGATYLAIGSTLYVLEGQYRMLPLSGVGVGLFTAALYAASFLTMNYVFGHPKVNIPIATAITAAYPAVTALVGLIFLGQRFTFREACFFCMAVGGVVGLGLSGKK